MTDQAYRARDMNPLAQAQAEQEILRLNRLLSDITEQYAAAVTEAAEAEVDFDLAEARIQLELMGGPMTIPEKQAECRSRLADEYARVKRAKAVERQLGKRSGIMLGQLSALQSINANVRHAVTHSSGRGG